MMPIFSSNFGNIICKKPSQMISKENGYENFNKMYSQRLFSQMYPLVQKLENNSQLMMQLCSTVSLQLLQSQNKLTELIPIAQRALQAIDEEPSGAAAAQANGQPTSKLTSDVRLTALSLFRKILIQAADEGAQGSSEQANGGIKMDRPAALSYLHTFIPSLMAQISKSKYDSEVERVRLIVEALHTLTQICEKFPPTELQQYSR